MSAPGIAWSDAALALFRLEGATGVSAGAGAGKTTALVELLLRIFAGDTPLGACAPRGVVAITFTEKAGAELAERLEAARAGAERTASASGDGRRAACLSEARRGLPAMAVGTIHGFAGRLLREHAVDAGVEPDFAVLEEEQADDALARASVGAVVASLDAQAPGTAALASGPGGARGLASMVARLVRERGTRGLGGAVPAAPGDADALARRAGDLAHAADELLRVASAATSSGRAALETLSAGWPAVRAELPGVPGRLADLAAALRRWRPGRGDGEAVRAARDRFLASAAALPALAAEVEAAPLARALASLVEEAELRYAAAKAETGSLDFDDLLAKARDLLRDAPAVRREQRERIRALLVDEYQDVNTLQAEIFDLLAGCEAGEARHPVLVAVGDAKQSIYRFRGADVGVFASLLGELGAGGRGRVLHLRENHRSVPGVVALVNDVLRRRAGSLGVAFGAEDELEAMRGGGPAPAAELLQAGDDGSAEERREREARLVAARIGDLVSGRAGVEVWDGARGERRPPRCAEVAVLLRRLTTVGAYERALRDAGIPCRVGRGGGFYQASEVRDLGELAASLADPGDEVAWAALLRSPLCGLSDGSLFVLSRLPGGRGLARLARMAPEEAAAALRAARPLAGLGGETERLRRFLATWVALRAGRGRLDVGELLARAAGELDLEAALLAGFDGERRRKNLRKALDLACRAAGRGEDPAAFAARLRRMSRRPPREPEADLEVADAVAILSIHQAKGLEWPVAVIPDLGARLPGERPRAALDEQGRVCLAPLAADGDSFVDTASLARLRERSRAAEAEEAMRLFYVALTRARDYLVLSSAGRAAAGSWAAAVAEAPAELVRRVEPAAPPEAGAVARAAPSLAAPDAGAEPGPPVLRGALPTPVVRVAVTALAEYARCPRRHFLARSLRLPEPGPAPSGEDDPERATERGTLAHALLAEVDLLAPPLAKRALLAAAAARRGHDPGGPGVRKVVRDVERFLDSEAGRRLAAFEKKGVLRREVPFLLRLDATEAPVYLDGAIDALAVDGGEAWVLDFKYAAFRRQALARYRLQLTAYALAAGRAWPGCRLGAEIWFLRGAPARADVTPSLADLERFAREAPALARGAARASGRDLGPADLGRSEARCRAEGCGYTDHCFAAVRAVQRTPRGAPAAPPAIAPPDTRVGDDARRRGHAIQAPGALAPRSSRANPSSRRGP